MRLRRVTSTIAFLALVGALALAGLPGASAQEPGADLSVAKTDDPDPVSPGGIIQYLVSVTNHGPADASGVRLRDLVSGGTILSFGGAGWSCTHPHPVRVECTLSGSLAAGATSAPVEILVRAPDEGGEVENRALTASDVPDPNLANNDTTQKTTVNPTVEDGVVTFCPPGGCTFSTGEEPNENDTTVNKVTVPPGGGGSVTRLTEGPTTFPCGADPTFGHESRGQETDFLPPTGLVNQENPIVVVTTWHVSVWPVDDPKVRICMRKERPSGGQLRAVFFTVSNCRTPGIASPSPCIDGASRDAEGNMSVRMLMLSPDPQWRR